MRTQSGYTLIETLLGLVLSIFILTYFLDVIQVLSNYPNRLVERQNQIGLTQLRQTISLGKDHHLEGEALCMNYQAETTCFEFNNGYLYQYPGTQVYLINLTSIRFILDSKLIKLEYEFEKTTNIETIGLLPT